MKYIFTGPKIKIIIRLCSMKIFPNGLTYVSGIHAPCLNIWFYVPERFDGLVEFDIILSNVAGIHGQISKGLHSADSLSGGYQRAICTPVWIRGGFSFYGNFLPLRLIPLLSHLPPHCGVCWVRVKVRGLN